MYVIVACIAINSTLPIWLRLAKIWDHRKTSGKEAAQAISDIDESEGGDDNTTNEGDIKYDHDIMHMYGDSSVVSDAPYSTVSSTVSSQLTAVLESLHPRRTSGHRSDHKRRRRERDIRYAGELSKLKFDEKVGEVEMTLPGGNLSGSKSVMSKLSVDDVSMNDGVNEKGDENVYNGMDSISYERRSCWATLLEVSEYDSSLASLAGFYMVQGLTETITSLVEVAVISHMIGITEANAFIMTTFLFEMTGIMTVGFQEGTDIFHGLFMYSRSRCLV